MIYKMAKGKGNQIPPFEAWQAEINRSKPRPRRILSKADAFRKPFLNVYKSDPSKPTARTTLYRWAIYLIIITLVVIVINSIIKGGAISEWLPSVLVILSIPLAIFSAIWDAKRRKAIDDE